MLKHFLAKGWQKDTCLSINIPDCPPKDIKGFSWARQSKKNITGIHIDKREDHRQQNYYWLSMVDSTPVTNDNSDYAILQRHEVAVTVLGQDRSIETSEPSVVFDPNE